LNGVGEIRRREIGHKNNNDQWLVAMFFHCLSSLSLQHHI
jgi:hypothetical protein